jgi:hypothetical protein
MGVERSRLRGKRTLRRHDPEGSLRQLDLFYGLETRSVEVLVPLAWDIV